MNVFHQLSTCAVKNQLAGTQACSIMERIRHRGTSATIDISDELKSFMIPSNPSRMGGALEAYAPGESKP
jgi:hypothetical protein